MGLIYISRHRFHFIFVGLLLLPYTIINMNVDVKR